MAQRLLIAAGIALAAMAAQPTAAGSAAGTPGERAAKWAAAQAGARERGTTNCGRRINAWQRGMGLRVPPCRPWCGALVHQAWLRAGVKLSARLIDPDRAYDDAVAGRRGLRKIPLSQVRAGDLLFYLFRADKRASHVELARGRPRNGKVATVGGNVSHAVRLQTRSLRYAVLAARVV